MHYTDDWPEHAKEAFEERMREEVKEEIRDEMEGCDEEWIQNDIQDQMAERLEVKLEEVDVREYWDACDILMDDESDKMINEMIDMQEQMNLMLKLQNQTNEILLEIAGDIDTMKTRLNMAEHGLWEFKELYCQKNGPFEQPQRPKWDQPSEVNW